MTDNWHNERNNVIENWHINNSRKDDRKLKATERPIAITYKDNKKDYEKDNKNHDLKDLKTTFMEKKDNSHIKIVQDKLDIIDEDKEKGMLKKGIVKEMLERMEKQDNSTLKLINSKETLRKKLDIEKDRKRKRHDKERERK